MSSELKTLLTVGVTEARARFSELLDRVAGGETITITRRGVPVVVIRPVDQATKPEVREAISRLGEIGKGKSLGGITIKELIEDGRRY